MRLGVKLSIIFIILSLVVGFIIALTFFIHSSNIIELRIQNQLEVMNLLKKNQLQTFIEEQVSDLELLSYELKDEYSEMEKLHKENFEEHEKLHEEIRNTLINVIEIDKSFIEIFFLDLGGKIHESSEISSEDKIKEDVDYFIKGLNSSYIGTIDYDILLQIPSLIISTPMKNSEGKVIGVLAGRLNLRAISNLITLRDGLGETGESYLINGFNLVLTNLLFEEGVSFKKKIFTESVVDCLNFNKGFKKYKDYRGEDVYGYYLWIPERGICLITKIDESEALKELSMLKILMVILFILIIIIVTLVSLWLARIITSPIKKLKEATFNLSQGKFQTKLNIHTKDEIEVLANTFVSMAKGLKESRKQLQSYSKDLERKVKQRTKQFEDKTKEAEDSKKATLNIMEDVAETNKKLKETEKLLKKNLREMKLLDKQKDEFISITSHELKTPITSIKGFIQLLSDPKIIENKRKRKKYVGIVNREVNRLNVLISDILDLSRLDLRTVKFNYEKVDIKELLDTVRKENELKAKAKKIKLELSFGKGLSKIENDRTRLLQIFTNLVVNAINYTHKGKVLITANKQKTNIHFTVEDTGIGISKKNFTKIFERFYQVDSGLTREIGGTGLGLAITKELVTKMNGKIWLESKLGKGTKFHVLLPINQKIEDKKKP